MLRSDSFELALVAVKLLIGVVYTPRHLDIYGTWILWRQVERTG